MSDPTTFSLEAAILDQVIAGQFRGKTYAYVPVTHEKGWSIGIATANEDGYTPLVDSKWVWEDHTKATAFCDGMNKHIGLSDREALEIVVSSMGGRPYVRQVA